MQITTKNVSREEAKKVEQMVKKCVRLLRKKEYELNLPTKAPDIAASVLKVQNRDNGKSQAGAHVIQIELRIRSLWGSTFHEYDAFSDHPTIGTIKVNSREEALWVLVAHEVAHHIQYRYCYKVKRFRETYEKPHGACFQKIYEYLRRDLVNPMIKANREVA